MPDYQKRIVYLSEAQKSELFLNGSITVDGNTIAYNANDMYVTPQSAPVTDVQTNGTSVTSNGTANIPVATQTVLGVVKAGGRGVDVGDDNRLHVSKGTNTEMKNGTADYVPVVASTQHLSAFYGLAKASGDSTQSQSNNSVGLYTDSAKASIQNMLGVSQMLAPVESDSTADQSYAVNDIFSYNGKLYKATSAINIDGIIQPGTNCDEVSISDSLLKDVQVNNSSIVQNGIANVPIANSSNPGVVRIDGGGLEIPYGSTQLRLNPADSSAIKTGNNYWRPIVPIRQHESTFYGLAAAAGDATQSQSNNSVGIYTDDAKAAIKTMLGVTVNDVQVNGTSIVTNGIANVPLATDNTVGVVRGGTHGITVGKTGNIVGELLIEYAGENTTRIGASYYTPITPKFQHASAFYGLAKAAGADMASSSNAVGTYTPQAKAAIQTMLGVESGVTFVETISGTTPTITAEPDVRYICGELSTLDITPASSGITDIMFTSGSTATVLTLPSTVKFPDWINMNTIEPNTIYEIIITDGVYGGVMTWPA